MAASVDVARELGISIKETVESAKEYKRELSELLTQLEVVETQIQRTAEKSELVIRKQFAYLSKELKSKLEERCSKVLSQVTAVRCQALQPLRESRQLITAKLSNAEKVELLGEDVLSTNQVSKTMITRLCEKASLLGSLPEVPTPASVASISVTFEDDLLESISKSIQSYGSVNAYSLVEICYCEERPGSILLHWMQREDDNCTSEASQFRLQCCSGNAVDNPELMSAFKDVFLGPDTCFLVTDLAAGTPYSFRVSGCYGSNNNKWSPWSQPYVTLTTLPHYEWESSSVYSLTHDNKIATKLVEDMSSALLSKNSLYRGCHCIQFKIVEMGITANIDEGLALLDMSRLASDKPITFAQKGAIHINTEGTVSVDGNEVSSRLSALRKGSTVTFDMEPLDSLNKIRITVGSGQGQVTYDWPSSDSVTLRFAMFFRCAGWKVAIE